MKLTGNTILVTGGGSGIGRGLAEAFHARGNQVIIAGRRTDLLETVAGANAGMSFVRLDVADPAGVSAAVSSLMTTHPALNVLINGAGIQRIENADGTIDDALLTATVETNLLGPIRLSSALLGHLRTKDHATIIHISSMLGYLPRAVASVYCATKAALHSFAMSQRYALRDTSISVLEIAPPYVQTSLLHGEADPRAMPLERFIADTMDVLATDEVDVLVPSARARRDAIRSGELEAMWQFNEARART